MIRLIIELLRALPIMITAIREMKKVNDKKERVIDLVDEISHPQETLKDAKRAIKKTIAR